MRLALPLPVPAHIPDPTLWSNVPVNGDPLALFMYTNDYYDHRCHATAAAAAAAAATTIV